MYQNPRLSELLTMYLAHLEAAGKGKRAVSARKEQVLPFIQWCRLRGVEYAPQVNLALLESYQRYLRSYRKASGELMKVKGQLNKLSGVRSLFRWLLEKHYILYNPAERLVLPREEIKLPGVVLTEEETLNIMAAQPTNTRFGLRNRAILETFWSTGIRRQELGYLMQGDINFTRGTLHVKKGKGGKERIVPIGDSALSWILRYLNEARPQLGRRNDSGHLFLSALGGRLSNESLTGIVARCIREYANLDKPGACHLLRHSMATQMLENGADVRYLQAQLGHAKLTTTEIYTRVAIGALKSEHERTHPGNRHHTERQAKAAKKAKQDNETGLLADLEEADNLGSGVVGQFYQS